MLARIAIRDIRKSWKRSLAVIGVVALSVALLEIGGGYMDGFREKIYREAIRESGHLRLTAPGYLDKLDLQPLKPNIRITEAFLDSLKSLPHVKNIRPQIRFGALANSVERTLEMQVIAAPPEVHAVVYQRLENAVVSGSFMNGNNQIMIGSEAAQLLKVEAGDSLILLTTDVYGGMSAVENTVVGVFESLNSYENSMVVLVDLSSAQRLLCLPGRATEVTVELDSHQESDRVTERARDLFGASYEITSWKEHQAGMVMFIEMADIGMGILAGIILVVASLGMINTFLLSVLERLPEFGTLRAVGLLPGQLIRMILLQGALLGLIGTAVGFIVGIPVVLYFEAHPIDYGQAMESIKGVDSLWGMSFNFSTAGYIALIGLVIAVFASLYPAWYASRKRPVEILRNIA